MNRQKITLKRGEEILVNGYVIRAVGTEDKPTQLQVYHPNINHVDLSKHDVLKSVYAGISDTVVCSSTLCIGTVGGLLNAPHGSDKAKQTAADYVQEHAQYFGT